MTRPLAAVMLVVTLLLSACASDGLVQRAPTDSSGTGYVGGSSLTRIAPGERKRAPVVEGPALSGTGRVSTADHPGKVVVINVWGSWCAPCRKEAPDLVGAAAETRKVAAFVGLNVRDYQPDTARAFVRAFGITYPSIYDPQGAQLVKFAGILPPNGIPTTLVVDRDGRVAARVVGLVSKTTLVGLVTDIAGGR